MTAWGTFVAQGKWQGSSRGAPSDRSRLNTDTVTLSSDCHQVWTTSHTQVPSQQC